MQNKNIQIRNKPKTKTLYSLCYKEAVSRKGFSGKQAQNLEEKTQPVQNKRSILGSVKTHCVSSLLRKPTNFL